MKRTGFSALELLVGVLLIGTFVMLGMDALRQFSVSSKSASNRSNARDALLLPVRSILKTGKTSRGCTLVDVSGQKALQCQGDTSPLPSGTLTWVRYLIVGGVLELQKDMSGSGTFATFDTLQAFPGIQQIVWCGSAEMSGGTCALNPVSISNRAVALGIGDRFFRFQIIADDGNPDAPAVRAQAAFTVITPEPYLGAFAAW